MDNVQKRLHRDIGEGESIKFAQSAEKAGLGPRTSGEQQKSIKAGRLKGQMFACEFCVRLGGADV
jgi:anoctamin-10